MANKKTNSRQTAIFILLSFLVIGIAYLCAGLDYAWFAAMFLSPFLLACLLMTYDNLS